MSTEYLTRLLKENPAAYKAMMEKRGCEASLHYFVKKAWAAMETNPFQDNWHVHTVCAELERITRGENRFLLINLPPRCGKPVSADALVTTKNKGLIRLGDIVVGDETLTHLGNWKRVSAVHRQGVIPTVQLSTRGGRIIDAAPSHPFLTPDGWVKCGDLKPDDVVGIVPAQSDSGINTISEKEARLLGYLIGDGSCQGTPNITSGDDIGTADMIDCIESLGFFANEQRYKMTKTGNHLRRISIRAVPKGSEWREKRSRGDIGPVRKWLTDYGLWRKSSYTKHIPEKVMQGTDAIVENFIGAYWSCDGWITTKGVKRDGTKRIDLDIGCCSVNRDFILQLQILLTRLGIDSNLRKKVQKIKTKKQGDIYVSYTLTIRNQDNCWRFKKRIKFYHDKYRKLRDTNNRRFDFDCPIWGDSVDSVISVPDRECVCLEVEDDHSFIANGFAVHNTDIVSVCWPLWTWIQDERTFTSGNGVRFLCASYGDKLTLDNADKMRDLANSPWFQANWGDKVKMRQDKSLKSAYGIEAGGARYSTSIGGQLLGLGGDILIGDDLHNTESVESDKEREATLRGWREFSSTRLNDPKLSAIVVVMQRLHEQDVSGVIIGGKDYDKWTHLMYPMRHDPDRHCDSDPRTKPGELMWPARFGEKEVAGIERELGPYMSSGRLGQSPSPEGGGIIKEDYWKLWPPEGETFEADGSPSKKNEFPAMDYVIASVDTAYSSKTDADFNAIAILGVWRLRGVPKIMLMHCWNKRLDFRGENLPRLPDESVEEWRRRKKMGWGMLEWTAYECARFKVDKLIIEGRATGITLAQEMRKVYGGEKWATQLVEPKGDKVARVYSVQHLFAEGMIYAPARDWAQGCIEEFSVFPKGKNDDRVDATVTGIRFLRDSGFALRRDETRAEENEKTKYRSSNIAPLYDV